MKHNKTAQDKFNQLRSQAEKIIQANGFAKPLVDEKDPLRIIHELQTFQVELELQIEELHRSQQELMQIQIDYVELYDTAPVGYVSANTKGLILKANLTLADMLSTERGGLIGHPLSDYIVFEDQDVFYHHLRNLSYLKNEQVCQLRIQKKDGAQLDVQLKSSVILDGSGDLKQCRIIITDISQLKAAEVKLKEEMKLRTVLIESLPHPTMLINKDRTIIFANKAAGKIGARVGGICRGDFGFPPLESPSTLCLSEKGLDESKIATSHEIITVGKTWEIHWVPAGDDVFLCYALDISERKQVEKAILQKRKMETIGTLVGGIAHNFNNLLYVIMGNAELAMDDTPKWNPAHASLEEIKLASLRATEVVKQLLDFSRDSDLELKPMGLLTVIRDGLKFLRSSLPSTVKIRTHLPDTQISILGDPVQIHQVLMNICTNASQAMGETGGILGIEIQALVLNEKSAVIDPNLSPGNYVKITIRDTGPGICGETITRIFDPYFTTRGVGEGSGMGLAVVHGIVKNHDGAILVKSKPGNTQFSIFFPMIDKIPEIKMDTKDKIPHGTERILFIDDEQTIVDMSRKTLEKMGYQVETKSNPIHALDVFQSKPNAFDLIITDMIMPQMSGINLAEKLKAIRPDIPIIICTGHRSLIDADKAKQIGIAGFAMKPISVLEIAKIIRSVLDQ